MSMLFVKQKVSQQKLSRILKSYLVGGVLLFPSSFLEKDKHSIYNMYTYMKGLKGVTSQTRSYSYGLLRRVVRLQGPVGTW